MGALKDILVKYEEASGQRVNLQKSSIFFGKGCQEETKVELKDTLGINSEVLSERYLGLPTLVGRSKDDTFKYVTESSKAKVSGWKGQGLSKAAIEVLIKSGLQAIPTFTMSCFHLTKKMCRNLTSISSKFWWGATNGERKMHWISWEKLCASKRNGGLGFRDPEAFNQALLAKQAWRILQVPTSLCARVLKARYFQDNSIMTATCPSAGSYTFRCILHGRDLLREGVIWRIGEGSRINIHHDHWIPRSGSLRPLGQEYMHGVTKVADLLALDGTSWDVQKVDTMFTSTDAADIKQITVGGPGVDDFLAWNFTKNGEFTVRSAYHLRMALNKVRTEQSGSSSSVNLHKGYMGLWDTSAPAKAKLHMWRVIRNGLAVGAELHRRRIKPGIFCVACGREETVYHRFWACQHSSQFWQLMQSEKGISVAIPPSPMDSQSALASWLLGWFAGAADEEKEAMVQAVYGLWLARNEARDGKRIVSPHEIMASVYTHMQEWRSVHEPKVRSQETKITQRWEPPEEGWLKVNSDGDVSKYGEKGGGGAVIRDHNGAFRSGMCKYFLHIVDPEAVEVLPIDERSGLRSIMVQTKFMWSWTASRW